MTHVMSLTDGGAIQLVSLAQLAKLISDFGVRSIAVSLPLSTGSISTFETLTQVGKYDRMRSQVKVLELILI